MNSITSMSGEEATMTSKEIADLCEARHNDVTQTIERLKEKGVLRESRKTRKVKPDGGGRSMTVYDLNKRDTLIVVSGYRDEVRAKIIDRWMELEEANKPAIPQTFAEALRLAADNMERAEQAEGVIDRISSADGLFLPSDAAKELQIKPKALKQYMVVNAWIFKRPNSKKWTAYQSKIQQGLLTHKTREYTHPKTGDPALADQVMITPKGLTRLAKEIGDV